MTTSKDKFFFTRTLCCLLKALEGEETEIELRNESRVKGTIETVAASMSVTMRNCVLTVNDRSKFLHRIYIQGRKIRMVLVPNDINMLDAMQRVIGMYNIPLLGRKEFISKTKHNRGFSRGRGRGDMKGRSRAIVAKTYEQKNLLFVNQEADSRKRDLEKSSAGITRNLNIEDQCDNVNLNNSRNTTLSRSALVRNVKDTECVTSKTETSDSESFKKREREQKDKRRLEHISSDNLDLSEKLQENTDLFDLPTESNLSTSYHETSVTHEFHSHKDKLEEMDKCSRSKRGNSPIGRYQPGMGDNVKVQGSQKNKSHSFKKGASRVEYPSPEQESGRHPLERHRSFRKTEQTWSHIDLSSHSHGTKKHGSEDRNYSSIRNQSHSLKKMHIEDLEAERKQTRKHLHQYREKTDLYPKPNRGDSPSERHSNVSEYSLERRDNYYKSSTTSSRLDSKLACNSSPDPEIKTHTTVREYSGSHESNRKHYSRQRHSESSPPSSKTTEKSERDLMHKKKHAVHQEKELPRSSSPTQYHQSRKYANAKFDLRNKISSRTRSVYQKHLKAPDSSRRNPGSSFSSGDYCMDKSTFWSDSYDKHSRKREELSRDSDRTQLHVGSLSRSDSSHSETGERTRISSACHKSSTVASSSVQKHRSSYDLSERRYSTDKSP